MVKDVGEQTHETTTKCTNDQVPKYDNRNKGISGLVCIGLVLLLGSVFCGLRHLLLADSAIFSFFSGFFLFFFFNNSNLPQKKKHKQGHSYQKSNQRSGSHMN